MQVVRDFSIFMASSPASLRDFFLIFFKMALIVEKIRQLLTPIIETTDVFLVDIVERGERTGKVIEVYIDTDKGITLDECSGISRELSVKLDESDIIPGRYRLDVSSPGLNRPLKIQRQYMKNVGRVCRVTTNEAGEKIHREGTLESVTDQSIFLLKNGIKTEIAFSTIVESFIIPQIK